MSISDDTGRSNYVGALALLVLCGKQWFTICLCAAVVGVLLTAICLMIEMCEKSPDMLAHFRKVRLFDAHEN